MRKSKHLNKVSREIQSNIIFCFSGTSCRSHDEECYGERKMGVLPKLSLVAQLDAKSGEADRADRPR